MAVRDADLSAEMAAGVGALASSKRRRKGWAPDLVVPGAVLALVLLSCFLGPVAFSLPSPTSGDVLSSNLPMFSPGHLFGTNAVGNDVLSQVLYGGRVSIEIALATNLIGLVVGGTLGALAGYASGIADTVIMRFLDVFIAFPSIVLALVLAEALQPSELHVVWALSFFAVPSFARISRSAALKLREQNFLLAARLAGTRMRRALLRHIAPLVVPQLVTFGLLFLGVTILVSAALSYLGLSVPPPNPTWGNMISSGQPYLSTESSLVLVPSVFLFVTVLCFNLLGDALRARWAKR